MTLYPQSKVRMLCNDVIRLLRRLTYCGAGNFSVTFSLKEEHTPGCVAVCGYWHWISVPPVTPLKPPDLTACRLVNSAALSTETNASPGLCRSGHLGSNTDYSVGPPPLSYFGIFERLLCRSSPLIRCPKTLLPVQRHMQLKCRHLQRMPLTHSEPLPRRQMPRTDSLKHDLKGIMNCSREKKL